MGKGFSQPLEKTQVPDVRPEITKYYADLSPESPYFKTIANLLDQATNFLDQRLAEYKMCSTHTKFAIVLDIDETSISNYPSILAENFSNSPEAIDLRYHQSSQPPILPTLNFYQKTLGLELNFFFVSARKPLNPLDDLEPYVVTNLKAVGYTQWTELILPKAENAAMSCKEFKTHMRQQIEAKGYKILLNIGDQDSDIEGGYAECAVKLPNLLYGNASYGLFFSNAVTQPMDEKYENLVLHR